MLRLEQCNPDVSSESLLLVKQNLCQSKFSVETTILLISITHQGQSIRVTRMKPTSRDQDIFSHLHKSIVRVGNNNNYFFLPPGKTNHRVMNRERLPFFRIFTEPVGYYSKSTALGIDRKTRFRSRKSGDRPPYNTK